MQTLSLPALRQSLVATFFDLAAAERFDYVPFFPEGDPPRHAKEYLLYAFALRLDEWGDEKGRMTEQYVEETVRAHFDRYNIAHGPLFKTWDYDAETGIYTAIPQGIKSLPMCSLRDFHFSVRDGNPLFDVTLDFCSFDGVEPGPDEAAQVRQSLLEGDFFLSENRVHRALSLYRGRGGACCAIWLTRVWPPDSSFKKALQAACRRLSPALSTVCFHPAKNKKGCLSSGQPFFSAASPFWDTACPRGTAAF